MSCADDGIPRGIPHPDLTLVLANWREQATVLRMRGHPAEAKIIDDMATSIIFAARPYLNWLNEEEAMLRSGRGRAFLRHRFPEWEKEGMSKLDGRRRLYRQCIVPRRANLDAARLEAEVAAKQSA